MTPLSLIATSLILVGVAFLIVAAVGFLRLPDVFCRLHVTGVIDTLGGPLILLGAAIHLGPQLVSGKLLLILVFTAVTSPLIAHLLARAALDGGYEPQLIEEGTILEDRTTGRKRPDGRS